MCLYYYYVYNIYVVFIDHIHSMYLQIWKCTPTQTTISSCANLPSYHQASIHTSSSHFAGAQF